jgi:hypothetical protein
MCGVLCPISSDPPICLLLRLLQVLPLIYILFYLNCYLICGVVWCGVVWCGVVWCGILWVWLVWGQEHTLIAYGFLSEKTTLEDPEI